MVQMLRILFCVNSHNGTALRADQITYVVSVEDSVWHGLTSHLMSEAMVDGRCLQEGMCGRFVSQAL